ncbi:hypothetical protein NUW58_g1096 [Xylaria curta]|uniref:Uncharacterized protein n=1 Tax=Xylaria curta TaxID=42375 RepID=A0ACC1PMA5_9PEZI|nr:hypothetical protein NUW58_g1096 [Xylaria curta]
MNQDLERAADLNGDLKSDDTLVRVDLESDGFWCGLVLDCELPVDYECIGAVSVAPGFVFKWVDDRVVATPEVLGRAIDEFLAELKQKHREDAKNPFLQALISHVENSRINDGLAQSEVSAQELQSSVLELDARKRTGKGYRLLHRLSPFLEIFKTVLKKCEAFAQVAPFGVAIAFVGARIVLEMALAVEEYLEIVVTAMEGIAEILEIYQKMSTSPDLGARLVRSYQRIITFCYKLSKVLSSSKAKGILPRAILTPLKKETEESLKGLQEEMHINLGISQAASPLFADKDRQARENAQQRALKNDIKRWIMGPSGVDFKGDRRFLDWHNSRNNAVLFYTAQPGSGKSVLASAIIYYLTKAEKKVAYFFYSFSKNSRRYVVDGLRILALQLLTSVGTPSDKLVDLYETESQLSPCLNNLRVTANLVFVSEALGKLTSKANIKAELKTFPKKPNGYYTRTLAKIDARGRMEQQVARRIFLILSSARQAMSIDELVDALAIQHKSQEYSAAHLPKEELIKDLCGPLIVIEQHASESNQSPDPKTCDLGVDESLHKYFVAPSNAHQEIGLDCLTYLMYKRYAKHMDLAFLDNGVPKEHAFLRYAATFWFQHLGDEYIDKPSTIVTTAVQEFISSKNFWNCLRVQSQVVPYLFERYTRQNRGFKMGIKGREWKGDDSFALPLPAWLGDVSPGNLLRDQSLCHFAEEWREVIITQPNGLDQCVSMNHFASSCWLKPLSKTNTVRCVNLAETFGNGILATVQIIGVGFSGKKLWVDVAYQTRHNPADVICRLKQPLFKANSQPQWSHQRLPIEFDMLQWAICPLVDGNIAGELVAWSVDTKSLDLIKVTREHNERIKVSSPITTSGMTSKIDWEILTHQSEKGADVEAFTHVIHISNKKGMSYEASSDKEGSADEGEFSDDDTASERPSDESTVGEETTDESDIESRSDDHKDTDCLIVIQQGHSPHWTKPWTHSPLIWSRIVCAVHPTEPLVAFMYTPAQLEVVDMKEKTERLIKVSDLMNKAENVLASVRAYTRTQDILRRMQSGKHIEKVVIKPHVHDADATFPMWIDMACINQTDAGEKASQTPLMRRIYSQAAAVIIWINDSEEAASNPIRYDLEPEEAYKTFVVTHAELHQDLEFLGLCNPVQRAAVCSDELGRQQYQYFSALSWVPNWDSKSLRRCLGTLSLDHLFNGNELAVLDVVLKYFSSAAVD